MRKRIFLSCLTLLVVLCFLLSVVSIFGAGILVWRAHAAESGNAILAAITIPFASAPRANASAIIDPPSINR